MLIGATLTLSPGALQVDLAGAYIVATAWETVTSV